ncbi:MAG: hypothetical protein AAF844_14160 [Pseudomonadota bacterium]
MNIAFPAASSDRALNVLARRSVNDFRHHPGTSPQRAETTFRGAPLPVLVSVSVSVRATTMPTVCMGATFPLGAG